MSAPQLLAHLRVRGAQVSRQTIWNWLHQCGQCSRWPITPGPGVVLPGPESSCAGWGVGDVKESAAHQALWWWWCYSVGRCVQWTEVFFVQGCVRMDEVGRWMWIQIRWRASVNISFQVSVLNNFHPLRGFLPGLSWFSSVHFPINSDQLVCPSNTRKQHLPLNFCFSTLSWRKVLCSSGLIVVLGTVSPVWAVNLCCSFRVWTQSDCLGQGSLYTPKSHS